MYGVCVCVGGGREKSYEGDITCITTRHLSTINGAQQTFLHCDIMNVRHRGNFSTVTQYVI